MLTITLDESDCFAAWVSAKDAGFTSPDGSDPKCEFNISIFLKQNPSTYIIYICISDCLDFSSFLGTKFSM